MKPVKDSQILQAAAKRIKNGTNSRICYAIGETGLGSWQQREALVNWVMHMLGKAIWYETWLERNHPKIYQKRRWDTVWLRQARLAWLNWMIEQCVAAEKKS